MFPVSGKRTSEQSMKTLVLAVVLALAVLGGGMAASALTGSPAYACQNGGC